MTTIGPVTLYDGSGPRGAATVEVSEGRITAIRPADHAPGLPRLFPAPVDLQVNGGGGLMLEDARDPADLATILDAHRRLGTGAILPTLISGTEEEIERAIDLVAAMDMPGILGLHLEGPHIARAGAHDPTRLRPLTDADVARYASARARLPHLLLTLAPEMARSEQIAALAEAGVVVSLGHSDCDHATAIRAFGAGARMATHLFNAMSGLHHREPGLAGAALDAAPFLGLIADGIHVHDAVLRITQAARPEAICLVSDAMAVAGTGARSFTLGNREVRREAGRLTLSDGTLAGADISLLGAARHMARACGITLEEGLPLAFDTPWRALTGVPRLLAPGTPALFLKLDGDRAALFDGVDWRAVEP